MPPTLDSKKAVEDVTELLTTNVPYGSHVFKYLLRLNLKMFDLLLDGMLQPMSHTFKNLQKIHRKFTLTMNGCRLHKEEESLLWESSQNCGPRDNSLLQEFWVQTQMLMGQMSSSIWITLEILLCLWLILLQEFLNIMDKKNSSDTNYKLLLKKILKNIIDIHYGLISFVLPCHYSLLDFIGVLIEKR